MRPILAETSILSARGTALEFAQAVRVRQTIVLRQLLNAGTGL
jgi:hypothetical protein